MNLLKRNKKKTSDYLFPLFLLAIIFQASVFFRVSISESRALESTADDNDAGHAEADKKQTELAGKEIVAKVNGAEITMLSLVNAMNRIAPEYVSPGHEMKAEITEKIKNQALDALIFEELVIQEGTRQEGKAFDEKVDKALQSIKERAGSGEEFNKFLEKLHVDEKGYRELIRRQQLFELMIRKEIEEKMQVDEELILAAYEEEKESFVVPENIIIEDVFIRGKSSGESEEEKAAKLHNQVVNTFNNNVWELVLDGTFSVRKLNLSKERYPSLHKIAMTMEAGDVSSVIEEKDGFHFFKLKTKKMEQPQTLEQVRPLLEKRFGPDAKKKRKQQWEKDLRSKAKIEVLLNENNNKLKNLADPE